MIELEKKIYLDLLSRLDLAEQKYSSISYEQAYNEIVDYINDKITSFEVAEQLLDTKQYTIEDDYRTIVYAARDLGIDYVGVSKEELLEKVNKRVI